jgi:hypothetical protein
MIRQLNSGDFQVTSTGRWILWKVTPIMFLVSYSIQGWRSSFQTQKTRHWGFGTWIDEYRSIKWGKTQTDSGFWLPTLSLTTLQLGTIMEWWCSNLKERASSLLEWGHMYSLSRIRTCTIMTYLLKIRLSWLLSIQMGSKSLQTNLSPSTTTTSTSLLTI